MRALIAISNGNCGSVMNYMFGFCTINLSKSPYVFAHNLLGISGVCHVFMFSCLTLDFFGLQGAWTTSVQFTV